MDTTHATTRWSKSAWVSVLSNAVAVCALVAAWHGFPAAAPLGYTAHKLLHIIGVLLFMGNLIAGPLWVLYAYAEDDPAHLRWATQTLAAADIWLTTPGVQLTLWNGLFLGAHLGGVPAQPWLVESVALVLVSSVLSVTLVLPAQERLIAHAQQGDRDGVRRALLAWSLWGTLVMVPFSAVGWLMVSKAPFFP